MQRANRGLRVLIGILVAGAVVWGIIMMGHGVLRAEPQVLGAGGGGAPPPAASVGRQDDVSSWSLNGVQEILNVEGSNVTTDECYDASTTQTLCFSVQNGSSDGDWIEFVRLTFPSGQGPGLTPWNVACGTQDAADSSGAFTNFQCDATTPPNEVRYTDNDADAYGEIAPGASWGVCVQVTVPAGYDGPREVHWAVRGDGDGAVPHEIEGVTLLPACTPLMLKPDTAIVQGCSGVEQLVTLDLWNKSAGDGEFNLFYDVPSGKAEIHGPPAFQLTEGDTVTFTVAVKPDLRLPPGDTFTGTIAAEGNGHFDLTTLVYTTTEQAGWQSLPYTSPVAAMDNVVVWASHADGGLWSIGGLGADGATQRLDPETHAWSLHTPETVVTPTIEYPMDGCYGLNAQGEEIVVLFPDTIVTDTLHVYNITQDTWSQRPIPVGYPPEGRWAHDVVSLLNVPGVEQNVCYLSGGSEQTGGGGTRDLWRYDPVANTTERLGPFPASVWFGFHASWYVPWIGNEGAICVAGGIDHNYQVTDSTQCYDLQTGTFNALNADLGTLPEPWWGMADGWQIVNGKYRIWLANGVAQNGVLLPASAFADADSGGFQYGPATPEGLYRLEGDAWQGQFVTVGGARGGFWASSYVEALAPCPTCYGVYLPLTTKNLIGAMAR